jgi:hypothetical protein
MKGKLTTITVDGSITSRTISKPPLLEELQKIVGGYIETVPYFNTYEGERAVAFCNEKGKLHNLPLNITATALWMRQVQGAIADALVGNIAIVTGDQSLMKEL